MITTIDEAEMQNSGVDKIHFFFVVLMATMLLGFGSNANAATLDSVPHIHHLKVVEKKVLVLTHAGLFELVGNNDMRLVSENKFDVMGFTTLGKALFASGHPAEGSKMPNPIGLVKSIDGGLSWKTVSLEGEVDFHFLEGSRTDLYGADAQTGNLLYSANSGKRWSSLGTNKFSDIAVSPKVSGVAVAIMNSDLLITKNAFKSITKIESSLKITQIEWRNSGLYALSGSALYKSTNLGKTWTKLSTFKGAPGILSVSDQMMLVTLESSIYTSKNNGKSFKKTS